MDGAPQLPAKLADSLDLIRSCGVDPTDAEIVWLAELRRRCDNPPGRETVQSCSAPIEFCGVKFWPLHNKGSSWFSDWFHAFEDEDLIQHGVYLYAHAQSEPGNHHLRDIGSFDQVRRTVLDWLAELPIHKQDFGAIMDACYRMDNGDEITVENPDLPKAAEQCSPQTLEEKAANLCQMFPGTTPDYWMYDVSMAETTRMAAAVSIEGGSTEWHKSPLRAKRIASYLAAVKIIARRGMKHDG